MEDLKKLEKQIDEAGKPLQPTDDRSYFGASGHHPCERNLYYKAKGTPRKPIEARVYRIFQQGHDIEEQTINLLKLIPNLMVEEIDRETGRQFQVSFLGGHIKGHFDGRIRSEYYFSETSRKLLEIKSANDKNFKLFQSKGVRATNETYYAQSQIYMHGTQNEETWKDHSLTQCLFVIFNKNTAELHIELIDYSPSEAELYLISFENALTNRELPPRISENPNWYQCKFCDFKEYCFEDKPIEITKPRQCKHTQPNKTSGGWYCTNTECDFFKKDLGEIGEKCQSVNE